MSSAYWLEGVRFGYAGRPVLHIERLAISSGRITALIGANGAGKSTLLNVLGFLLEPQAGALRFFGAPVAKSDLLALRRRVGWVPQSPLLLRGTVLENVELGLRLRGVRADARRTLAREALARVGLADLSRRSAQALSGGEAQKAALARVLALNPEVLLFDEPLTYLDEASSEEIRRLMAAFVQDEGKTVVFSSHERLRSMVLADQVVSLFEGRPVATPLINVLRGTVRDGRFETEHLTVFLPANARTGHDLALDPRQLVLSRAPLQSSLRNTFPGRIVMIAEEGGEVRVTVDAGERFHALVTRESFESLGLGLGKQIWVSFKATAAHIL